MNGMWGYKITDQNYKSTKTLIHYLVKAAGKDANLLMNIGPQPDGELPEVAVQRLKEVGEWMSKYGETIYGTRGGLVAPHDWGVTTQKGNKLYVQKISKERVLEENIDFGLISPYKAQVQYIRKLIKQDAFFKPLRRLITVHTVDGFQGQERDVILISLVRANEDGKIGFLNDLRRMNVAITRARMKLMILGDASTLTRHAFYKELYNYISQRGKIITINTKQEHEL